MSTNTVGGPSIEQKRKVVTSIPGPKSLELQKRRTEVVSAGVSSTLPVYVKRAGGGIVEDIDGNSFIDLAAGIAVTSVGNSHPDVVKNVQEAVTQFTHTCFMIAPYESYVKVCELLAELTPGNHPKRSALFNSGAEALENAVKIARYFTKKDAVVVVEHGYHGRTNLTLAMTAKNMPYKKGFGPFAPEIYRVPTSYPFHDGLSGKDAAQHAISRIEKEIGADQLAAIVIEPIQGEGGFIIPAPGFLTELANWSKNNNVLFIADEVQTGFARTGAMFASEHENVVPDLITMAKGMGGGLPVAAVT
ncbi:MAG: aminotransferase class III-fold pyridoxal phosphate-dependent enzyme, partial [Actinobacteria bacterium]|nr:aminotransferase class III-fold pyridoxal phosphate-dependent enzyme [Actinomycetota bacterium]